MCDHCDYESWLDEIHDAVEEAETLPERAEDFAASVVEKLEDIAAWVEDNEHITEAQQTAVENMRAGIEKWLH